MRINFSRIIRGRVVAALSFGCNKVQQAQLATITGNFRFHKNYATQETKASNASTQVQKIHQLLEMSVLSAPKHFPYRNASVSETTDALGIKKRLRRKQPDCKAFEELSSKGFYNVTAFATAEEYDLEKLLEGLTEQNLYAVRKFFSTDNLGGEQDVLYVTANYQVGAESRDIFFFREGSVVFWNFKEIETNNMLSFLRQYEKDSYLRPIVRNESEVMSFTYIPETTVDVEGNLVDTKEVDACRAFFHNGKFFLTIGQENFLQKYTFSDAMATSIKLGIWEAMLDRYIDSMEYLTEDLKKGRRIRISRSDVLRKTGELFALRHLINLSSDLLDTPDFYWDREELEALYLQVCSYFSVSRRTKVMNEKINHCLELAELISSNLNDAHHIRLEWMIIILIMVEVGFEIVHYTDRFYVEESATEPQVTHLATGF